jgi:hypothetical protein
MKHTKGPWKIENHTQHTGPFTAARLEIWSNNRHIGTIHEHVDSLAVDEANATLIAAAPELLENLEQGLRLLRSIEQETGYCTAATQREWMRLLAKAKGGAK